MRALVPLIGVIASVWLLSNCQNIVGIKDHTYSATNPECGTYCDLATQQCGAMGTFSSLYSSADMCTAVCNKLDSGPQRSGNTLECRENLLRGGEPADCPKAGPGGGNVCGSNCDAYCSLYSKICPTQFNREFGAETGTACVDACSALPDTLLDNGGYNVVSDAIGSTVQCRLSHLSTAALDAADCTNVGLRPGDKCTDEPGSDAFCKNFCTYAMNACPGTLAIYENKTQCFNVCKALPPGTEKTDISHNTMICRAYHISNVLLISRTQHCPHLGPGGDGHCGPDDFAADNTGSCESYCILLEKACPDKMGAFADAGGASPRAQCEQTCNALPGAPANSGYTVATMTPDAGPPLGAPLRGTLQCRILHLARALEHPDAADMDCAAAVGGECN